MVLGQYMVWGCYLISLGNFLSHAGMAQYIGWFYAVQCVVSLFMPAAAGYATGGVVRVRCWGYAM